MTLSPFVFSNNPRYRFARHALFWLLWILYYTVFQTINLAGTYPVGRSFLSALVEVLLTTPLDMVFCYSIMYYLLPRYLYTGKYLRMILLWLLFSMIFVLFYAYARERIVPMTRQWFGMSPPESRNIYWLILYIFYQVNLEGCLALAIKLGKMWVIKHRELELIKKEKQTMGAHALEGRMQPVFLLDAIDRIERLSLLKPSLIPGMIQRVKSLLQYVVYDTNQSSVPLEKELKLLEEYVELEKSGMECPRVALRMVVSGVVSHHIAPYILLPLIEHGFRQIAAIHLPEKSMDIEIRVHDGVLEMWAGWSKPIDTSTLNNGGGEFLQTISRRLDLLYPQSHSFKIVITTERFNVQLRMDLRRAIN